MQVELLNELGAYPDLTALAIGPDGEVAVGTQEAVGDSGDWSAARPHVHRYELDVDRTGAFLRDQETGRLLLRWTSTDEPLRSVARLRLDPRELGLRRPDAWTVWSRPDVPSYR